MNAFAEGDLLVVEGVHYLEVALDALFGDDPIEPRHQSAEGFLIDHTVVVGVNLPIVLEETAQKLLMFS